MRATRGLAITTLAALLTVALVAGGCGVSTGQGTSSATGPRPQTYGGSRQQAPPAASRQSAPAALPAPKGTLVLVATATDGPYRSLALTLSEVALRQDKTWLAAAQASDLAALNKQPVDLAARTPLLLAVGSAPAGPYQALRLRFEAGPAACYLRTADAPKRRRKLALPEDDCIVLPLEKMTLFPGRTTLIALSVDLSKVAAERDAYRVTPEVFTVADPSKVVGAISGAVAPPTALARVWACWADPPTPISRADVSPADGAFTIPDLPPGKYFLRVTAGGYEPVEDRSTLYRVKVGATSQAAPVTLLRRPR